jgi:hypothetical protein
MIRIFVGCASGDDTESQSVLEYTLRKHASMPLDIVWMQQSRDPASPFYVGEDAGWNTTLWSTPFSGFRWAIPELCGFEGQAIYMDSDMIVMDDIAKLWLQEFHPGKIILAKGGVDSGRFCVAKWDCAAAKAVVPSIKEIHRATAHHKLKKKFRSSPALQPFAGNWNCIDGEDYTSLSDPGIKILHYSAENVQPQLKYAIPRLTRDGRKHWFDGAVSSHWRHDLVELFDRTLEEAKATGFDPEKYAPAQPYGPYRIQSHADYVGNRWSPVNQSTG